jgi:leader peptidase (prepilin peptidase)/N-methyltransferase
VITPIWFWLAFFFALGACVGSFLNVVIWRLPHRGQEVMYLGKKGKLTLSWPPSHCPVCDAPIKIYDNVPILGWLWLGGKCRGCKTPIAIRYPLVELATGVLFVALFLAYFVAGWNPAIIDLRADWPIFVLHLIFIAVLLAASAIDADWYIIPLSLPALLAALALLAAPFVRNAAFPAIDANLPFGRAALGGVIGLLIADALLQTKVIKQSFALPDSDTPPQISGDKIETPTEQEKVAPPPRFSKLRLSAIAAILIVAAMGLAWPLFGARIGAVVLLAGGILLFLLGVLPRDAGTIDVTDEVAAEIAAPAHPRLEILHELLFILFPVAAAAACAAIPFHLPSFFNRPLGVALGFLAGGGIVWLVRILGTLLFNKEAMGLGDVHLMAGVGAITGAKLAILAFFLAPFLGILWVIVLLSMKKPNILPYGPWLSIASIATLIIGDPLLNWYIAAFLTAPST